MKNMWKKVSDYFLIGLLVLMGIAIIFYGILYIIGYQDTKNKYGTCNCTFNQKMNQEQWGCVYKSDYLKYPAPKECPNKFISE